MEEDELEALLDNADSSINSPSAISPPTSSFLDSASLPFPPRTLNRSTRSSRTSDSPRRESSGIEEARPRRLNPSNGLGGSFVNGGMMGNETKRLSLAFELASAVAPAGNESKRDLMRSLGIDEEELGEQGQGEEEYSDVGYSEQEEIMENGERIVENGESDDGMMRTASRSNDGQQDRDDYEDIDSESSNAEDLPFDEATTALEDSLRTTDQFLLNLRQHIVIDFEPSPSHILSPPLSTSLQRNAKSSNYIDRQPIVEALAATLIKSLYEAVKVREAQNRELGLMEREVAETGQAWEAILAGLEELPEDDEVGDVLFYVAGGEQTTTDDNQAIEDPLHDSHGSTLFDEDHTITLTSPSTSHHRSRTSSPPIPAKSEPPATLSSLRLVTSSLITTLSTITDHTQISRSSTTEAGRKLRSLRSHLLTWAEDLASLAASEEHMRLFEAAQLRAMREENGGGGRGRFGVEARDCLRGVESAMESFEERRKEWVVC